MVVRNCIRIFEDLEKVIFLKDKYEHHSQICFLMPRNFFWIYIVTKHLFSWRIFYFLAVSKKRKKCCKIKISCGEKKQIFCQYTYQEFFSWRQK